MCFGWQAYLRRQLGLIGLPNLCHNLQWKYHKWCPFYSFCLLKDLFVRICIFGKIWSKWFFPNSVCQVCKLDENFPGYHWLDKWPVWIRHHPGGDPLVTQPYILFPISGPANCSSRRASDGDLYDAWYILSPPCAGLHCPSKGNSTSALFGPSRLPQIERLGRAQLDISQLPRAGFNLRYLSREVGLAFAFIYAPCSGVGVCNLWSSTPFLGCWLELGSFCLILGSDVGPAIAGLIEQQCDLWYFFSVFC